MYSRIFGVACFMFKNGCETSDLRLLPCACACVALHCGEQQEIEWWINSEQPGGEIWAFPQTRKQQKL